MHQDARKIPAEVKELRHPYPFGSRPIRLCCPTESRLCCQEAKSGLKCAKEQEHIRRIVRIRACNRRQSPRPCRSRPRRSLIVLDGQLPRRTVGQLILKMRAFMSSRIMYSDGTRNSVMHVANMTPNARLMAMGIRKRA